MKRSQFSQPFANARLAIIGFITRDWCASSLQTDIQRLLQLGVRLSYPTSVLNAIRELSLPELVWDQYNSDDIPVRARLPNRKEWVEVRGCLFCAAITTYTYSTHSDTANFVDAAQATLHAKSHKILLLRTTGSVAKKLNPSSAAFLFFDEIRY